MPGDSGMWWVLADFTLFVHASYVFFVIGGQLSILAGWILGWGWTRHPGFRFLHLLAIGFVMLEAWLGVTCPLTLLENMLRAHADSAGYNKDFVAYWLGRLIFYAVPDWIFTLSYSFFTALVILTWLAYPPRGKTG
ncbi:MAG: DUF2784 domain-containing protein [Sulfuricaulis sp.]